MNKPIHEILQEIDTPAGKARLKEYLLSCPFPHFEAHLTMVGLLIMTLEDGTQKIGSFKGREFVEIKN